MNETGLMPHGGALARGCPWDTGSHAGHLAADAAPGHRGQLPAAGKNPVVVSGCIDLLHGRHVLDDALILVLGGPPAQDVLGGHAGGKAGHWPRVWAVGGLLHARDDRATAVIIQATADDAWRVREMAAKVSARHRIGDAFTAVAKLRNDQVPRVRAAAERAVVILTTSGA